jgi:two-component system phosphate regulon sensor histidine kinase PhoR
MPGMIYWALILIAAGALLWWFVCSVLMPAREVMATLRRIALGDFRPVILSSVSPFFRQAAMDLRVTAETLALQKTLLAEEEFSLSVILESMTEGVVITGSDLRIRVANKAAASMFNLPESVTGLLLQEVFVSHELHGVARRAVETGEIQRGELSLGISGRLERCHLLVTAASLKVPERVDADGVLLVLHDISRLRELESVRREFVANVSHEFRTPLSIINGYLETLEEGGVGKEMMRKSISVMRRHAERLNCLIEDLLTISRMEEKGVRLEMLPTDIVALLKGVVEQLESEITERAVTVELEIPRALPLVEVDAYRMDQALSNLLVNALRHGSPTGGGAATVRISLEPKGSEISVGFRDNGPGIPLQDQEHLFERFYRVGGDRARQTGGSGLGLSIVKNVVQAHGGRVTLESKPGAGSLFTIFLPVKS